MIAKAMEWIKAHTGPNIINIDGAEWSDKQVTKIENIRTLDKVNFYTLSSLIEYLKSEVDVPNSFVKHIFVNVESPNHVLVYSDANEDNHYSRTQIAEVNAMLPVVKIGQWVEQTEFCIMMRANFIDNGFVDLGDGEAQIDTDRDALISVASNIVSGTIAQYEDTGITQKATLKTGIQESEDKLLPEKVTLRPYRTFLEVEQPKSEFIFRAQDTKYDSLQLALYEADGGRWKMDAMASIKEYLKKQLSELEYITITA
ncbi:MAG: hypothetical protein K2K46_01495 [Lachnospiraceae bacterium]|nr:hypothetical protein [Lachnospiraceae bacterium]